MKDYLSIDKNGVRLSARAEIIYTQDGKKHTFIPDFSEAHEAQNGDLSASADVRRTDGGYEFSVGVRNVSGRDIILDEIRPAVCENVTVDGKICAFLQKRHKNDLPGAFMPSVHDEAFGDMCISLSESGSAEEGKTGSEFSADSLAVIRGEKGSLMLAFLTERTCLCETVCRFDEKGKILSFEMKNEFHCLLRAGAERRSELCSVSVLQDTDKGILEFAREKAKRFGADVTKKKKPSVWCSWSYYAENISPEIIRENLSQMKKRHMPYSCVQLDDGWEKCYGDWTDNEIFASDGGIKELGHRISEEGYTAGIWTCPLIVDKASSVAIGHPDWLLCDGEGSPCIFNMVNVDYFVLDPTVPAVLDWIRELYRRLTFDCGYKYHKTDFTRAVVVQENAAFADPEKTAVEAYVSAISAARKGMGEDAYFVMCGGLYDALIGIVDAQRTGSDVLSMWLDPSAGKPKIPYTVKQNVYRSYMNEWWHNDPDSMMVRRKTEPYLTNHRKHLSLGTLTDEEAKTFTANQYFGGGLVCSTENLSEIESDRLLMLRHVMPPVPDVKVKPGGTWSGERFPSCIICDVEKKFGAWRTLVFLNWGETPMPIEVSAELCDGADRYVISGFYSGRVVTARRGETVSLGEVAPHGAEIVRIGALSAAQIVGSNMHYSFGGELDDFSLCGDELHFAAQNPYDFEAEYRVLLCAKHAAKLSENVRADGDMLIISVPPLGKEDIRISLE